MSGDSWGEIAVGAMTGSSSKLEMPHGGLWEVRRFRIWLERRNAWQSGESCGLSIKAINPLSEHFEVFSP